MGNSYKLKSMDISLPSILYGVYFLKTEFSKQEIYWIENVLNKLQKEFPYISYLFVVSNTKSKYCVRRKIVFKGEKGKPLTIVIGKKINTHIHLAIIGDEKHSPYKFIKALKEELNKKEIKSMGFSKGMNNHAKNFINYVLKQANKVRKTNKFNDLLEEKEVMKCYL